MSINCSLPKPMQSFIISKVPAESLPKASTDAYSHCVAKTSTTTATDNLQCNPYHRNQPGHKGRGTAIREPLTELFGHLKEREEPLLSGRESNICQEKLEGIVLVQDKFVPQTVFWGYPTTLTKFILLCMALSSTKLSPARIFSW